MSHEILSLLLSATCIIVLSGVTVADDWNVPPYFTVTTSDHQIANIYQSEVNVHIDKAYRKPNSYAEWKNNQFMRVTNANITFKAFMIITDRNNEIATQSKRITHIFKPKIMVIGQRFQNSTDLRIHECRFNLVPTVTDGVDPWITMKIIVLLESCLKVVICPKIAQFNDQDLEFSSSRNEADLLSPHNSTSLGIAKNPGSSTNDPAWILPKDQSTINYFLDNALHALIEQLREKNESIIPMPNINKSFFPDIEVFETNAHIKTANGTFRDLTTIRRQSDAILSHKGMKLFASCEFGLDIAKFTYDRYKLKYGIITVNGTMSGDIDGMAIEAKVSIDYKKKPCLVKLEHPKITRHGKMRIHLTGFGKLNGLASKLLDWMANEWPADTVRAFENEIRKIVQPKLTMINCERFRP